MGPINIKSFVELELFLRNAPTVSGGDEFDFTGLVALLAACLDNLATHAVDAELEEIGECLTESQQSFLKKLAKYTE